MVLLSAVNWPPWFMMGFVCFSAFTFWTVDLIMFSVFHFFILTDSVISVGLLLMLWHHGWMRYLIALWLHVLELHNKQARNLRLKGFSEMFSYPLFLYCRQDTVFLVAFSVIFSRIHQFILFGVLLSPIEFRSTGWLESNF